MTDLHCPFCSWHNPVACYFDLTRHMREIHPGPRTETWIKEDTDKFFKKMRAEDNPFRDAKTRGLDSFKEESQ